MKKGSEREARLINWQKWGMFLIIAGTVLVNIKGIFVDFDVDSEYALAMSYRMLKGDRMFQQMWEPHQTSAFLCTFFMKIYLCITGTFTGVAIYLHIVGLLIYLVLALLCYKVLSKRIDKRLAMMMGGFLMLVRPKDILMPEYSNMQLWFSVSLFLCLLLFLSNQERIRWLVLASVCLCLEVISYPSCVLVYFIVASILFIYSERKGKNIVLFTLCCVFQGVAYVAFFWFRIGNEFWSDILNIVSSDGSHGEGRHNIWEYFFDYMPQGILMLVISLILAFVVDWLSRKKKKSFGLQLCKDRKSNIAVLFFLAYYAVDIFVILVCLLFCSDAFSYVGIYLVIVALAIWGLRYCQEGEKQICVIGMLLSAGSFIATLLLTNLNLMSVIKYLILGVMVSFVPVKRILEEKLLEDKRILCVPLLMLFLLVTICRRGLVTKTISLNGRNLTMLQGIIKSGPAMGLITDYMGAYIGNSTLEEWPQHVQTGDHLLMVGGELMSTIGYLYEDTYVSVPSTICTPTFDDKILEYWEKNPDKFPDVIAVGCWYGNLLVEEDSWIMQWIENEYQPSTCEDGKYWRYYRIVQNEQ